MAGRPWYKRYGGDFVLGTMGMSLEEKGAYSLCLDLMYARGGAIPDDPQWLSGVCGVSTRKWNIIRARLIELGKLECQAGRLTNARAETILAEQADDSADMAERGRRGGLAKAAKGADPEIISDLSAGKTGDKSRENEGADNENSDLGLAIQKQKEIPTKGGSAPAHTREAAPPKTSRRKPETKIADGFPDQPALAWAIDRCRTEGVQVEVRIQAEKFRNHAQQNDRSCRDWQAAWRNWILGEIPRAPKATKLSGALSADSAGADLARWRHRLRELKANGYWPTDPDVGARPGRPGCRAPPEILAEFGFGLPDDDPAPLFRVGSDDRPAL